MTIVVATTLHAFATDQQDSSEAWLYNADEIAASHPEVRFFAALETDARGIEPFEPLLDRMASIGRAAWVPGTEPTTTADYWTFQFDDHADKISSYGDGHPMDPGRGGRLRRITTGQNFANIFADSVGASHLLFCAADCAPPPDVLPKLLELDHPICGPEIPTYCLTGPEPITYRIPDVDEAVTVAGRRGRVALAPGQTEVRGVEHLRDGQLTITWDDGGGFSQVPLPDVDGAPRPLYPDFPVQEHMASAACILLGRDVFTKLRWRTDGDAGLTDDPALHHDALHLLGYPTYVRKDCVAKHYPEAIGAIETRGHDMTVRR